MATSVRTRPRTTRRPQGSADAADHEDQREEQLDLLTAALIGVAIGVSATLLLRRGPRGSRPVVPIMRAAGRGALWAGRHGLEGARWGGGQAMRAAEWARDRGGDLWDRVPVEQARERVSEYLEDARDAIADAVESEVDDLRKAVRKQRKKLGI